MTTHSLQYMVFTREETSFYEDWNYCPGVFEVSKLLLLETVKENLKYFDDIWFDVELEPNSKECGPFLDAIKFLEENQCGQNNHAGLSPILKSSISQMIAKKDFISVFCDSCKKKYMPSEITVSQWSKTCGMEGKRHLCPQRHTLNFFVTLRT